MESVRRALGKGVVYASVIALVGTVVFAQGAPEKTADSDASQNSPAQHRPHFQPLTQVGDMEVLSDSAGLDFGPYLRTGVLPYIRGNWQRSVRRKESALTSERQTLAIEFTILKDGSIDNVKVVESSGDANLDSTALDGIARAAPFLPLPAEFRGQYLELKCHFYYRPGRIMQFESAGVRGGASRSLNAEATGDGHGPEKGVWYARDEVTMPRAIYSPNPEYTEPARKAKVNGVVVLKVTVDPSGDVGDVKVVKGIGYGLDESAIATVRTWKFKPGSKDGNPVKTEVPVEIDFRLR